MITVVCGILIWGDKVLIGKRLSDNLNHPNKWEFPGGKIESNETAWEACKREFKEELDIDIHPLHELRTLSNDEIEFIPFISKFISGKAKLNAHSEVKFVTKDEFIKMDLTQLSKEAGKSVFDSYGIFFNKG